MPSTEDYYDLIQIMAEHFYEQTQPDEFTIKRIEQVFGSCDIPELQAYGLGYLAASLGDMRKMQQCFKQACQLTSDPVIFEDFLMLLQHLAFPREWAELTLELAPRFKTSENLNYEATKISLIQGDTLSARRYFERLNHQITDPDEKLWVESQFHYHLKNLQDAYRISGCTPEQIRTLTHTVFGLFDHYQLNRYAIYIDGQHGGHYQIDLHDIGNIEVLTAFRNDLDKKRSENALLKRCPLTTTVRLPALFFGTEEE